jgi:hypothetical protein
MAMDNVARFSFTSIDTELGEIGFRPLLPITLINQQNSLALDGLLDTGATINVLPYGLGLQLGYEWSRQTTSLSLTGNLAQFEARVIVLQGQVGDFNPARLVFAWTEAENVPLILGQANFFMEFDVCFYRSQLTLDVRSRSSN